MCVVITQAGAFSTQLALRAFVGWCSCVVVLLTQARGASRGNVRRHHAGWSIFHAACASGFCEVVLMRGRAAQPSPRREPRECASSSHKLERLPSACDSGFCGVVFTRSRAAHPSPRRKPRKCATSSRRLERLPSAYASGFCGWCSCVVARLTQARGASRGSVRRRTVTRSSFTCLQFGRV